MKNIPQFPGQIFDGDGGPLRPDDLTNSFDYRTVDQIIAELKSIQIFIQTELNPVPYTRGGTGLTFLGTPGQVLVVNGSGTAIEWGAGGGGVSSEDVEDIVANLILDSASIDWTYNDFANTLEAVVLADTTTQKVAARKNSTGADIGTRRRLNFIEGDNIAITVVDDSTDNEIDITVAAASSPGGADTQVQFNDSGAFGGDSGFTFNKTIDVATLAGGLNISPLTTGSIIFSGASGSLSQNNTKLFWNNTLFQLGIGTATTVAVATIRGAAPSTVSTTPGTTGASGIDCLAPNGGDTTSTASFATGGTGGAIVIQSGAGGQPTGASNGKLGGLGGPISITSGAGSITTAPHSGSSALQGGYSGEIILTSGNGGASESTSSGPGSVSGGFAGNIIFQTGSGGAATSAGGGLAIGGVGGSIHLFCGHGAVATGAIVANIGGVGGSILAFCGNGGGPDGDGGMMFLRGGDGKGEGLAGNIQIENGRKENGSGGFSGSILILTSDSDAIERIRAVTVDPNQRVHIGTDPSATGRFNIIGVDDSIQSRIREFSTQTENPFVLENSSSVLLFALTPTGGLVANGDISLETVGNGLHIKEGSNATSGIATLSSGTVTVNTTKVTANSRIYLTAQNASGTHGSIGISARTASTSFTITSTSSLDTRDIAWLIIEPA